ncbi:hypothetical protein HDU67_004227 [Dinochytrium kinnereticum]|nr:hypothetical protein HDU67_004227 [Dinochytrium kinnereticum]
MSNSKSGCVSIAEKVDAMASSNPESGSSKRFPELILTIAHKRKWCNVQAIAMKQRFSALDVAASVSDIKPNLIGLRLQNVYDINPKTYLFKFGKPDSKEILLIESGVRIHTTTYEREKSKTPNAFSTKLRKYIKTRRLSDVRQVGLDRVVDLVFGEGDYEFHLILEFYSSGNIILTDKNFKILAILRSVELSSSASTALDTDLTLKVGEKYALELAKPFAPISSSAILNALTVVSEAVTSTDKEVPEVDSKKKKKGKWEKGAKEGGKDPTVKKVLRDTFGSVYGPALVEHALASSNLDVSRRVASLEATEIDTYVVGLLSGFQSAESIISGISSGNLKGGWITQTGMGKEGSNLVTYDEFIPFKFAHLTEAIQPFLEFTNFNESVDEFYSKIESQKLMMKAKQAELTAAKKLDNVKAGHQAQVAGLEKQVVENSIIADAIESNLYLVDTILMTVRSFVASGMDWKDLWDLIKEEAVAGNAAAKTVKGLKLNVGMITVTLPVDEGGADEDEDEDEFDEDESDGDVKAGSRTKGAQPKTVDADVSIYKSAYANACDYYGSRKSAAVKVEKTAMHASKAFKNAEKKIKADLDAAKSTISTIRTARKPYWFEKFNWFISSENFLILFGRDAIQTEVLLRRHLKENDVIVSNDAEHAPLCIIKCPPSDGSPRYSPIGQDGMRVPPPTLQQASIASLAHSSAWEKKQNIPAWWIKPSQIEFGQKSDQYGSAAGSFTIKGSKNYIAPSQIAYGFGILFVMDESNKSSHFSERRPWARDVDYASLPPETALEHDNSLVSLSTRYDTEIINDEITADQTADDFSKLDLSSKEPEAVNDENATDAGVESLEETATGHDVVSLQDATVSDAESDASDGEETVEKEEVTTACSGSSTPAPDNGQLKTRHLSAKERRSLKKSGNGGTSSGLGSPRPSTSSVMSSQSEAGEQRRQPPSQKALPRGKKAKLKRAKERYADQDDEDKQVMMEVLGVPAKKIEPTIEKDKGKKVAGSDSQGTNKDRKTHASRPKLVEKDEPVVFEDFRCLDLLISQPLTDDNLHFAIPICAPFTTLSRYKYKLKLTQGTLKKGKAAKSAQHTLSTISVENGTALERELISHVSEVEMTAAMLGKVKIEGAKNNKK